MKIERIIIDPNLSDVYLDSYISDKLKGYVRKAILVIPGGGYGSVESEREGEPIAMAFLPYGYNAFVLHYSVARTKPFPAQLIEASLAIKHIRDHAEEYGIDPTQVFVTGFSAGGHLCACLGTMWHKQAIYDAIPMPYGYNRPTGIIPVYPVVSGLYDWWQKTTFKNLLCTDEPTQEQLATCSVEANVDERSVPAFIVHTSNDQVVNVRNALVLANAYAENGLLFEMHIYPDAPHGVALGNKITRCGNPKWENPQIAKWVEQAAAWADGLPKIGD